MAKVNPITGKWSGKLAGTVWAIRNGENIIRERNSSPYNPKSNAQVQVRAKLKLLSQLSAVCAPVIAIPRLGPVSSRNRFTAVNYHNVSYSEDQATIVVNNIALTTGTMGLPTVVATREGSTLSVRLGGSSGVGVDRMIYALFIKGKDNALRYAGSQSVSVSGDSDTFPTSFQMVDATDTFVVLAYGVRLNNEDALIRYDSMQANPAETFAKLMVTRVFLESDVTLTETRGTTSVPPSQAKEEVNTEKKK